MDLTVLQVLLPKCNDVFFSYRQPNDRQTEDERTTISTNRMHIVHVRTPLKYIYYVLRNAFLFIRHRRHRAWWSIVGQFRVSFNILFTYIVNYLVRKRTVLSRKLNRHSVFPCLGSFPNCITIYIILLPESNLWLFVMNLARQNSNTQVSCLATILKSTGSQISKVRVLINNCRHPYSLLIVFDILFPRVCTNL